MIPLSLSPDVFRKSCSRFATGIAVATTCTKDGIPCGLTINSFTSVSCAPPLVLICVDYRCNLLTHFRSQAHFAINILEESQRELSRRFSQRLADRFEGLDFHLGETGVPLLAGCLAAMECSVTQVVESGDHAIFIGEVVRAEHNDGNPLIYFGSTYRGLADTI